jgi:hypothetical protein
MKVTPTLDFTVVQPEQSSLSRFVIMLRQVYQNLARAVNGHLGFGDGVNPDNLDGVWVTVTFTSANADTTFTHNLGRVPVAYFVAKKSQACDIFTGTLAWTSSQMTLQGTVAGTTVLLFVA